MMWQSLKNNIDQVCLEKGLFSMNFKFLVISKFKKLGLDVKAL